jgi:hypothetical protein
VMIYADNQEVVNNERHFYINHMLIVTCPASFEVEYRSGNLWLEVI